MFNWFWDFLYMISKTFFRLIDGMISCANKLCGIEPIGFNDDKDFLSYLLFSDEIGFAFRVSALIATILLVLFTIFMILRSITKDKAEGTPAQIAVKSFKTLLMFFFVPIVIILFMTMGNAFISALYAGTSQGSISLGRSLFCSFALDGGMKSEYVELFRSGELDCYSTSVVNQYMDMSEFPFLFSWIAGGVVLFGIGYSMLTFVDRVLSLVILYIAAPISISTSVLDDGARFKLWRDQFLNKFIMGYGMIIAINIYALVCGLVTAPGFTFFENDFFLDLVLKLTIIAGGALTMQKSMALIGNLIASGAGSNELRDNAFSMGQLAHGVGGVAAGVLGAPGKMLSSLAKSKNKSGGDKSQKSSGNSDKKDTDKSGNDSKDDFKLSKWGADNNEKPKYGNDNNSTKNAIIGNNKNDKSDGTGKSNNSNANTYQPKQNSNSHLSNAINGKGITESKNKDEQAPKEDKK